METRRTRMIGFGHLPENGTGNGKGNGEETWEDTWKETGKETVKEIREETGKETVKEIWEETEKENGEETWEENGKETEKENGKTDFSGMRPKGTEPAAGSENENRDWQDGFWQDGLAADRFNVNPAEKLSWHDLEASGVGENQEGEEWLDLENCRKRKRRRRRQSFRNASEAGTSELNAWMDAGAQRQMLQMQHIEIMDFLVFGNAGNDEMAGW